MGNLENAKKVGLRNKKTDKIIAVYPNEVSGTDEEISKIVKDWYYMQNCSAEEKLTLSYVDSLTDEEIKSHK